MKLGIIKGLLDRHLGYVKACKELDIDYEIIDIISTNWLENVKNAKVDAFLVYPPSDVQEQKRMFDEKLYFITKHLNKIIYPSWEEVFIYENKRAMSYWLDIYEFPHAKNWIFYDKKEALNFIKNHKEFPLIFKTNSGASASGVKILKNKTACRYYINRMFGFNKHLPRGIYRSDKIKKTPLKYPLYYDLHQNYIIFQEFIPAKWEWRIIKIGDSYFGHQKLLKGKSFSGSDKVGWVDPPKELLDMARKMSEVGKFSSMCFDIFESNNGKFYINELQSLFGSYDRSQMYINGKPGRYIYNQAEKKWVFEQGIFCQNMSCNLRVRDLINKLKNN